MLGALTRYAASRAVHGVTEGIVRRATWGGAAAVFGLIGLFAAVIVVFWWLERHYSREVAGLFVVVGSFILAAIAASMPALIERIQAKTMQTPSEAASEVASAVVEDTREALDYVGPLRLVGSAFMVGLGMGRRVAKK